MISRIAALCAPVLAAGPADAQQGDATRGAAFAAEYRAQCHDVSPTGPMKRHPPAFAAIVRFRPVDQIRASIWFPSLHAGMPQVMSVLDRQSVADPTAYILSLE